MCTTRRREPFPEENDDFLLSLDIEAPVNLGINQSFALFFYIQGDIMYRSKITFLLGVLLAITALVQAQIGDLIWEENFETLDNWIVETGNGAWGWGNGELEFYHANNVEITDIPDEPGNTALHITAKQETGPDIVDQWGNPLNYTSGRINTKSKVAIRYGMIETRVRVPDLDLGGWPAVWMLGTSNFSWPRSGEIDMMEMGHSKPFRDLHDEHNGGNGLDNSTVNEMVGANAIFYSEDAVLPNNPSGAASLSWDPDDDFCRPYYNYANPLIDRFLTYRTYWDASSLRFTVIDNGIEYDLYDEPFVIDSVSAEFQEPFYLIANLAIGGAFTDAYNLGDPGSGLPVSMPFPADMYIDYIKVMQWNGMGDVHVGPPEFQTGTFGLFTDETPTNNSLQPGVDASIFVWEQTLAPGTIAPYEGENGISWQTTGLGWFGAGIMSHQPVNLFNFGDGFLTFMIKIPASVTFKIGIIDAWGNQSYVAFPANQTQYGLVRNGEWGQASIPVDDIRGQLIDLRMLSYEFVILEENGASCEFALDDIYWEGGTTDVPYSVLKPPASKLHQNYPNPFNPSTKISFDRAGSENFELSIFNVKGQKIRSFSAHSEGVNIGTANDLVSVLWDGRDAMGKRRASGIYYYQLKTKAGVERKRCILLK